MNKAKELLNKLKEFVSLHKVVCLSAAGAVCAVAVTGIVVAVVLGNHSKADTVAGVETAQEETMQTIVMATVEEVTEETTAQTEAEEETETDVIETDSSLEFEYDGKKIVISADKPVELIPEEDLADKIIEDDSTTEIGADVDVDEPDSGNSKVNEPEKNYDIIVDNVDKTVTEGEEYAPLAGVRIDDLYNSSAPIGFTITDEAGNVVASMTGDEVKNYGGNPEDIKVTLENAGNYKVHYEYEAPGMTVTETVNGIDVSHWQNDAGGIDWGAVADAGYKFAMIKVAGRSIGDDGNLYEDNYFRYNIEQATANGIKVGVYFFSQALSVQEAYEEASYTLNLIKDYNITYPVAFDWETSSGYRTCDRLNKDELTSICEAFCDTVKSHGYQPMIYMSKNDWVNKVHTNKLTSKYNVWLAWYFYKYYNSPSNRLYEDGDEVPDLDFGYNIWQYTSTANIPGINGACDMNVAFATTYKSGDTKTKDITIRVEKKKGEPETTAPDKDNTTGTTTGTTSGTTGAAETTTGATTETTTGITAAFVQ